MTSSSLRKKLVIAAGGAVALVLIVAVVGLLQGDPSGMGLASSKLRTGQGSMGLASPPMAPSFARGEQGVASDMAYPGTPPQSYPEPYPSGGQTAAEVDQKIIKNGTLRLTVDRVDDATSRITAIATSKGGFVQVSSQSERADGTHDGQITIRVPAKDFEMAIEEIKAVAASVTYVSTSGQDVTEQYTDLEAQLRNAIAQEQEYLNILKKAQTVEDILLVQGHLGNIRAQIESLQGRLKYLENVTAYSTISVALEEEPRVEAPTKDFRPGTVVNEAIRTLIQAFQQLAVAVIWIAIVGGGLAVPVLLLALIVRALLRRRARPMK